MLVTDFQRQIQDVRKMRHIEQLKLEEADEEARIFAAAKRKMMLMRAERERELHEEKQRQLEHIKGKLSEQLSRIKSDEAERLDRAVAEAEEKFAHEEQVKRERKDRLLHEMDQFRKVKQKQLADDKAADRQLDKDLLDKRVKADTAFKGNELEKRRRARQDAQKVVDYQTSQWSTAQKGREQSRQLELAQAALNDRMLNLEEEQFQQYAKNLIEKEQAAGRKNVHPLREAARAPPGCVGLGPVLPGRTNYLQGDVAQLLQPDPGNQADDQNEKLSKLDRTKKRMGFTW